ncbi:MAG: sulfide-dependent adenosine diphosphate thiazole synthase [Candidatus Manganitrophus sp.]|nr:sulfide-dependent adenosine diphosphate thiazole synthase [Candidatus Manganitrophus sp.]MDC4226724.1 sulfide-dependent adenosine diphosphate thiazole synthase [Candidatus Manganitrophus sp.]WDT75638.1 MAG: sulfide-dependent adenosine diphosphate thiazole synthase [Candidatus Manganitrophus sp.]WDT80470.1 MAG: sulfide-dependent adenosine diphosphate thiazole synthase [Candidatus Manganitrophus sp.]
MKEREIQPLREADITRTIAREYYKEFDQMIESDVLIVGAGPSGLVCGRDLASSGYKVVIVEQLNHLGGGFWNGGYLMNKATIAHPAQEILEKIGVPVKKISKEMYIVDPPHATAKLIASAYDAGVKVMNMTKVVDLVLRGDKNRLEGLVVNWYPLEAMGHDAAHVDPIALESKIVVDATGHDAVTLQLLARRNLYANIPGNGAMWVDRSEEMVMEKTGEVYPNLFIVGLSVAAVYGTPRMGPAFGSMLLSGRKGAELIRKKLKR